jgi:hypothetical protein
LRVLIIPEDPTLDQYILKPIITAVLEAAGRPRANVQVCFAPLLRSVEQAMRWERISGIIDQYPLVDLFLLIVDRDGDEHRRARLDKLQEQAATKLPADRGFFAEHAWQEVEVWGLAGCHDLSEVGEWHNIRSERDPKEAYFNPYVERRGLQNEPGRGRRTLGREAASRYSRVRQRCPEDIGALEEQLRAWIDSLRRP